MKQMQDKYDAAMKEKTMMRLERDKVSGQLDLLRQSTSLVGSAKSNKQPSANEPAVRGSTQKNLAIARNKYQTRQSMEFESGYPNVRTEFWIWRLVTRNFNELQASESVFVRKYRTRYFQPMVR